mgnify:CR=1 FL=1
MMESRFWGDPSNTLDELRKLREVDAARKLRQRRRKALRIQQLVKKAKKGK